MNAFFLITAKGHETHAGKRGTLVEIGTAPGQLPLPNGATQFAGETLAAIRRAQGIAPAAAPSPAVELREKLAAFKSSLAPAQLADLWYPWREPIETALADSAAGNAHALDAARAMVRSLPFVAGRDDAIKAAALAIVGA